MTISYKLNKDVVARTATMLNWNLNSVKSSIRIITKDKRMINAKSLVGLLSGHLETDDQIDIIIDQDQDLMKVKSYFNEVGREI